MDHSRARTAITANKQSHSNAMITRVSGTYRNQAAKPPTAASKRLTLERAALGNKVVAQGGEKVLYNVLKRGNKH